MRYNIHPSPILHSYMSLFPRGNRVQSQMTFVWGTKFNKGMANGLRCLAIKICMTFPSTDKMAVQLQWWIRCGYLRKKHSHVHASLPYMLAINRAMQNIVTDISLLYIPVKEDSLIHGDVKSVLGRPGVARIRNMKTAIADCL